MSEEKVAKWRIGAYVSEDAYQQLVNLQIKRKKETGKKPSQGQVLEELLLRLKDNKN